MAFLINWLAAIGGMVILVLVYNNVLLTHPVMAAFLSLTALVFLALANVTRVNAMKLVPLSHAQALAGLLVVMTVIGATVYFAVDQMNRFTYAGQYAVMVWLFVLDALLLIESLLSFKNVKHPKLENKLRNLEKAEAR